MTPELGTCFTLRVSPVRITPMAFKCFYLDLKLDPGLFPLTQGTMVHLRPKKPPPSTGLALTVHRRQKELLE